MIDDNMIAVSVPFITGNAYGPIGCCVNGCALRRCKIKPRMHFYRFINGIDPVAKTGSYPIKVFVAYGLDCRRM